MKKVLYLTNMPVPYRVHFFNELAKYCDLTVLYESRGSGKRDKAWARREAFRHRAVFLKEDIWEMGKECKAAYDVVIVGCYNNPLQMLAVLFMRCRKIPYLINLDGEPFLSGRSLKAKLKRFFLSGAHGYLTAGEKAAESLREVVGEKNVTPYYFSSLTEAQVRENAAGTGGERRGTVLVPARYLYCKGNDIALECARMDAGRAYLFVGMGKGAKRFQRDFRGRIPPNVKIIPFLQKEELAQAYKTCAMVVLPSRQECWGLVIQEAASFGTPVVSTWGSGAAVEFLSPYPQYLARPGDARQLLCCIRRLGDSGEREAYSAYLLKESEGYHIERSVLAYLQAIEEAANYGQN